jgi:hypothetical protein
MGGEGSRERAVYCKRIALTEWGECVIRQAFVGFSGSRWPVGQVDCLCLKLAAIQAEPHNENLLKLLDTHTHTHNA